jgi:hypothetical protein
MLADPSWWGWAWIERASWIIAVAVGFVGLPATLVQLHALRAEQLRLRQELTAKPILQAGFGVGIEPVESLRLDPHGVFLGLSEWVPFDIYIVNTGEKSARDILLNVLFDSQIESEHAKPSVRSIDGVYFDPDQRSGTSVIIRHIPYIHPHDPNLVELKWRFPFRPAEYDVLIEASAADVETLSVSLKLRVTTDPEVRRVLLGR